MFARVLIDYAGCGYLTQLSTFHGAADDVAQKCDALSCCGVRLLTKIDSSTRESSVDYTHLCLIVSNSCMINKHAFIHTYIHT